MDSARRGRKVGRIEFDADETAIGFAGGHERGTRTAKGIQHERSWLGEGLDQRLEDTDGLLRGMEAIAGIGPVDDVGERGSRRVHVSFGQQIGLLMLIAQEARR